MEHSYAKFSCDGLVIWTREKRLIHLDAGVGNQAASRQHGETAGEEEEGSGSGFGHGMVRDIENKWEFSSLSQTV